MSYLFLFLNASFCRLMLTSPEIFTEFQNVLICWGGFFLSVNVFLDMVLIVFSWEGREGAGAEMPLQPGSSADFHF